MREISLTLRTWQPVLNQADELLDTAKMLAADAERWKDKYPSISIRSFALAMCAAGKAKLLYQTIQWYTGCNMTSHIQEADNLEHYYYRRFYEVVDAALMHRSRRR